MPTLRIEHAVPDFDTWKQAFDDDPIDRKQSRVRHHQIFRPIDDPNYVRVDLEFDSAGDADAVHGVLRDLWRRVQSEGLIRIPKAQVVEAVERKEY